MDAKELRKKLDEGLKPDSSGKTTPIQRLTPFLNDLMDKIAEHEAAIQYLGAFGERPVVTVSRQVSSDDVTELASPKTNSEHVGASKPAA